MTDYDLPSELAFLASQVYGGANLSAERITTILRAVSVTTPLHIITVQHGAGPMTPVPRTAKLEAVRVLRLHAGLEHWLCKEPEVGELLAWLDARRVLRGAPITCPGPGVFFKALRESVVAMRRIELASVITGAGDLSHEPRLRTTLIQHLAARDERWREVAARWLSVTVARHPRSLNNLRRKLIECLAQITRPCDDRDIAFVFASGIERIMAIYTYSGLLALFPEVVSAVNERLHKIQSAAGELSRARSAAVLAAASFVRDHYLEPISLEDVASAVGVSGAHLARTWRKEIGTSVGEVLRMLRLAEAKRLLTHGDRTVLDVALMCGFGSAEHFHRTFRAQHGASPDAWRRSLAEQGGAA